MNLKSGLSPVAVAALLIAAAGCSSSSDSGSTSPVETSTSPSGHTTASTKPKPAASPESASTAATQQSAVIVIKDYKFSGPGSVSPGSQVTVKNEDSTNHTVTADGDGGFDVTIDAGSTGTFTAPSQPGSYPYVCTFHGDMTGTLVVK